MGLLAVPQVISEPGPEIPIVAQFEGRSARLDHLPENEVRPRGLACMAADHGECMRAS